MDAAGGGEGISVVSMMGFRCERTAPKLGYLSTLPSAWPTKYVASDIGLVAEEYRSHVGILQTILFQIVRNRSN